MEAATTNRIVAQGAAYRLRHFPAQQESQQAVLLIPSLILTWNIFDLLPELSFIRFLQKNLHVYVLDWNLPDGVTQNFASEDYVTEGLLPAMQHVQDAYANWHCIGYCMGGLLLLGALCHQSRLRPRSAAFLAMPWDYHKLPYVHHPYFPVWCRQLEQKIERRNMLSYADQQAVFDLLQPWQRHASVDATTHEVLPLRRKKAVRAWLDEGVPLAGPVAQQWFVDWPRHNTLAQKQWKIRDKIVHPENCRDLPSIFVSARHDRLVLPPSSFRPNGELPNASALEPRTGHIGMMVGRHRKSRFWQPWQDWQIKIP